MANRRFKVKMKRSINIPRVIAKVSATIISLYVGNEIITQVGNIVNGTTGPFNNGFKLIGWTVVDNKITNTSGAGVLAVVGIVGIASIVMEFVEFNL